MIGGMLILCRPAGMLVSPCGRHRHNASSGKGSAHGEHVKGACIGAREHVKGACTGARGCIGRNRQNASSGTGSAHGEQKGHASGQENT